MMNSSLITGIECLSHSSTTTSNNLVEKLELEKCPILSFIQIYFIILYASYSHGRGKTVVRWGHNLLPPTCDFHV